MPIYPVDVPSPLAIRGPFAALSIDAQRRRVFAAGARSVTVIDADSGKILATVRIGGVRALALEPLGGHAFAGTSDGKITEIDPDRKSIVRSLDAGLPADLLLYDSNTGRLYADGSGRTALAVFDAPTFTAKPPVPMTGRIPGDAALDPETRELYVAFADRPEVAIVDPAHGTVRRSFPTPGVTGKRIVRFDDALGQIVVTGTNGALAIFDRAGTRRWHITVPTGIAACDLDSGTHLVACTSPAGLTLVQLQREAEPHVIATQTISGAGPVAFDTKTDDAVSVRADPDGGNASIQHFRTSPPTPNPSPSAR